MPRYKVIMKQVIYESAWLEAADKEEALKLAESNEDKNGELLGWEDGDFGDSEVISVDLLNDNGDTKEIYHVEDGKFKD